MCAVGYGDISPVTDNERTFVNLSMLIGAIVYAYTIGSIGDMVSRYNELATEYKDNMVYVNKFLLRH